ncbi:hypothetical protein C1752_10364 [Acaryochloris thomasi RCC1774]|uniref:Uncharacterized protein n=1 Tax=Acaryochloris thomasi RCC1774 TaxID=1764569 RepID=A0A2W1J8A9_9CYAN|nr:hypothetical protein [Acaryochloris thomasi]PZD70643.1 hypothetical protein C1752_10364 [Acaryochloris thomasi RCC1774]
MTSPSPSDQEPIGIVITPMIEQEMAQRQSEATPLLEQFGTSALQVAIEQYERCDRGMVLGLENAKAKKFLYVKQRDCATALWMLSVDMKRKVAEVVDQYSPESEAVVVMVVPPVAHLYLASSEKPMEMIEMQEVEQTTFTLPSGVSSRKDEKGPTVFYTFSHKKLGLLGRIVLHPISPTKMNVVHEVANPKGFEDARNQQKRLDIFLPLAQELIERLSLGLMR